MPSSPLPSRNDVIGLLSAIRGDIRKHGQQNYSLLLAFCRFINSLYCDCKYVEYWVFDMNFGTNLVNTEIGFELAGIKTIDQFVEFMEQQVRKTMWADEQNQHGGC